MTRDEIINRIRTFNDKCKALSAECEEPGVRSLRSEGVSKHAMAHAVTLRNLSQALATVLNTTLVDNCEILRTARAKLKDVNTSIILNRSQLLAAIQHCIAATAPVLDVERELPAAQPLPTQQAPALSLMSTCTICGWQHKPNDFTTMTNPHTGERIQLRGRLPTIVEVVHEAQDKKLDTKSVALTRVIDKRHPSQHFGDLNKKREYKVLFLTNTPKGWISLRAPDPESPVNNRKVGDLKKDHGTLKLVSTTPSRRQKRRQGNARHDTRSGKVHPKSGPLTLARGPSANNRGHARQKPSSY